MSDPDPVTDELRVEQVKRAVAERERAEQADLEHETDTHDRRAMKAEYLKAKLDERAAAERAVRDEDA